MELIAVLLMAAAGGAAAIFVAAAVAIARGEARRAGGLHERASRDEVAASLLHYVLLAGGMTTDEAVRKVRRDGGISSRCVAGIDVTNWGEWYAQVATDEQRQRLLDLAVHLAADRKTPIPVRQYAALLDLSFALGFHMDALARLRDKYGFDYVDHAKEARPRDADRRGGALPLFVRDESDPGELLRVLSIEGTPTRQGIIAAYRRLAAAHHPDRFHAASEATRSAETQRFIEITRAYEKLLAIYRD